MGVGWKNAESAGRLSIGFTRVIRGCRTPTAGRPRGPLRGVPDLQTAWDKDNIPRAEAVMALGPCDSPSTRRKGGIREAHQETVLSLGSWQRRSSQAPRTHSRPAAGELPEAGPLELPA